MTIPFATNSNMVISKYATKGLKKIFRSGFNYKKSGVIVMAINSIKNYQTNLFENENPKHRKLMKPLTTFKKKMDKVKIKLASQDLKKRWK